MAMNYKCSEEISTASLQVTLNVVRKSFRVMGWTIGRAARATIAFWNIPVLGGEPGSEPRCPRTIYRH